MSELNSAWKNLYTSILAAYIVKGYPMDKAVELTDMAFEKVIQYDVDSTVDEVFSD